MTDTLKRQTFVLLLVCAAAMPPACTTPQHGFMRFPAEMAETTWLLRSLEGEDLEPAVDTQHPFIKFDDEGGFTGHTGCNRFFGTYQVDRHALKMSDIGSTRMMCPDMKTEQLFLSSLEDTDQFRLKRTLLYLLAKDSILAVFEAE